MGQFKDVGNPAHALAEEMAEAIQVINKLYRFNGHWNEIPVGKEETRWQNLNSEMQDVIYQWERLKEYYDNIYNMDDITWGDCEAPNTAG
jgi:hypothetical protein